MSARVQIVVGLGYGDEGKGTTIDWLARHHGARTVVRFNGGAQAAHHVVLPDGRHHCFAQFGSGTFAGSRTHLSKFMLVNPIAALSEARALERVGISNPLSLLTVHGRALVTTPFHVSMNRLRELARGEQRHGSCGMGIGETVQDSLVAEERRIIRIRDLQDPVLLRHLLFNIRQSKLADCNELLGDDSPLRDHIDYQILFSRDTVDTAASAFEEFAKRIEIVDDRWLAQELDEDGVVLFEGAQGVLLDETYGFNPHTTWSNCTFTNAIRLLGDFTGEITRYGVTRAYATRHGAGPFVTEDSRLVQGGDHNTAGPWQGSFRFGHLDLVALRYALEVVTHVDGLVLTWLDGIAGEIQICTHYEAANGAAVRISWADLSEDRTRVLFSRRPVYETVKSTDLPRILEDRLGVKIALTSCGPTHESKIWRGIQR